MAELYSLGMRVRAFRSRIVGLGFVVRAYRI